VYNAEVAERAVKLIGSFKQTKGQWAGKPLLLEDWQKDQIIRPLFGTLNKDKTRQYRTCYVELPRKNGKSTAAAAIANYLLFFDGEIGAEIYSAANDRDQASIVFSEAAGMIEQEPRLLKLCDILRSVKRIVVPSMGSFYRAISAEAYTSWGYNPHGVIYDELHAAPSRELWDVLTTAGGTRRQPLIFVITTAGYDRNSICWELHDYACKVRDGIIQDKTFLPVIYSAPEDADWTDENVWRQANPALGTFRNIDEMRILCERAQQVPALEMTFRRLYLNQWVNSAERWLSMESWDACNEPLRDDLTGKPCYAGLDLSATTDLTALSLVFPADDGSYDVIMRFWIPGDTAREKERKDRVPYTTWSKQGFIKLTPGNVIDYKFIHQELRELREQYDIREIAFDRWGATKLSQELIDDDFVMIPFGQGFASMSPPTKELMNLVLGKKIRHGGHPVLRWNVDNLVVNQDPAGNLKPDKAKSTQKIDGCVAMIMAIDRATRHAQPEKSVYEDRGIITL